MQNYFDNEATSSSTLHATMKPARGGKCLVTLSTYEDRKEALLHTTIMDDAGTYRSKATKNVNTSQSRQKTDTLESRESKQEPPSHIPKPPPPQMTSNNNTNKSKNGPQTTSNASSNSKSFTINDQLMATRLSNSSQTFNSNNYQPTNNDAYNSRSNKQSSTTSNSLNNNRQTLRLGTVTIGEYRQQSTRREPEKFDFISAQKKTRGDAAGGGGGGVGGDTTPTNETLQSELQNTLTRANLRKSNGNGNSHTEHQRNCPLHQQQQQLQQQQRQSQDYANNGFSMEEVTKKLQKSSFNENNATEMLTKTNNRLTNPANGVTGVGILKNGSNRNGTNSSSSNKSVEKSIKFG